MSNEAQGFRKVAARQEKLEALSAELRQERDKRRSLLEERIKELRTEFETTRQ